MKLFLFKNIPFQKYLERRHIDPGRDVDGVVEADLELLEVSQADVLDPVSLCCFLLLNIGYFKKEEL